MTAASLLSASGACSASNINVLCCSAWSLDFEHLHRTHGRPTCVQSPHVRLVRVPWVLDHQTFGWKDVEVLYVYIYNQVVRVVPMITSQLRTDHIIRSRSWSLLSIYPGPAWSLTPPPAPPPWSPRTAGWAERRASCSAWRRGYRCGYYICQSQGCDLRMLRLMGLCLLLSLPVSWSPAVSLAWLPSRPSRSSSFLSRSRLKVRRRLARTIPYTTCGHGDMMCTGRMQINASR